MLILSSHLFWINAGYTFGDITVVREELIDQDPFLNVGSLEIHKHLEFDDLVVNPLTQTDCERITFIIKDDQEFDGDLSFLAPCKRLEYLFVSGISSNSKVSNIEVLSGLTKLKFLDLSYNDIQDLSPISKLENLEELYLVQNPYRSIEPLSKLHKLKKLEVYCEDELMIDRILQSSPDCVIKYCNRDEQECYTTDLSSRVLLKNN